MWMILRNAAPFLGREIDFENMEEASNKLPHGKSFGADAELSSIENGTEQRSMHLYKVNKLPLMFTNGWKEL